DDFVVRALSALRDDEALLARWRRRTARLLVDEAQDLDRTQLELALLLAAPANDVFLVGDDDHPLSSRRPSCPVSGLRSVELCRQATAMGSTRRLGGSARRSAATCGGRGSPRGPRCSPGARSVLERRAGVGDAEGRRGERRSGAGGAAGDRERLVLVG